MLITSTTSSRVGPAARRHLPFLARPLAALGLLLATAGAAQAQTPAATFAPVAAYGVGGSSPNGIAVADVNGDGKPDLLTANSNGTAGVLLGNGNGTFQAITTFSSGGSGSSNSIAVADVNGDGKLDLLVVNPGSGSGVVGVLLGNGNGTFQAATTYDTGNSSVPVSIAVADVNGDSKPDLLTANSGTGSSNGRAGVLLGNGNGTFQAITTYDTGGKLPYSIAAADVNGDGKRDLLMANYGSSTAGVLLGNGNGTFQAAATYSTGPSSGTNGIAVADVNGDGKPDLLTANYSSNTAGVLLGNGNGTFQAITTYSTGGNTPYSIAVADVNSDGKSDLLVVNSSSSTAGVLLGNGNGTFGAATTFGTGASSRPFNIAVADVNGDGQPDLLTANSGSNTAGVLLNSTSYAAPALTRLNPTSGAVGTQVTLTGPNLSRATAVSFNGVPASFTVVNASTITTSVPTGATRGLVTVTTPGGTSNGVTFTVTTTVNSLTTTTPNPTNAATVTYTLTFGAPVTGLTAANFSLTTTGLSGATVGTPVSTGTGSTWTVPVSAGSGSGTLALNLANDTGLSLGITNSLPFVGATYTIDKTAPTVAISSSTASSGGSSGSSPFSYTITFSESTTNFVQSDVTVSGGTIASFGGSGNTYTLTVTPGAAGSTVNVSVAAGVATDAVGNGNVASNTYSITASAAPTVTTNSALNTTTTSVTLTGNITSNGGAAITGRGVVYSSTNSSPVMGGSNVTTAPDGTSTGTTTQVTLSGLTPGTRYYFAAYATNSVGTSYGGVLPFVTTPNRPVVTAPANNSFISSATPTYTGTAQAGATVTVYVDGTLLSGPVTADASGNWSKVQPSALSQASHAVSAKATVTVGSTTSSDSEASISSAFTVDTTPPAAPVVTAPANNSSVNTTTPTYSGTAGSDSRVAVFVDGTSLGTTPVSGGTWSLGQPSALAQGSHTVRATASDPAGNTSASSASSTFTVDTAAPAVVITSTAGSNGSTTGTTPIPFTVTFSEAVTGFAQDGLSVNNGTSNAFSGSGTTYTFNVTPSGSGATVTVSIAANKAQDLANNGNTPATPFSLTYRQPVVATSRSVTVQLDAAGNGTLQASDVNNGSTGAGPLTYTIQKIARGRVPENSTLALSTPNGANFTAIRFASFGTPSDDGQGNYRKGSCDANGQPGVASSVAKAQTAYVGQSSGSLLASTNYSDGSLNFGDPCFSTPKYLAVQAAYSADAASLPYACTEAGKTQYVLLTVSDGTTSSTSVAQVTVNPAPTATISSVNPTSALRGAMVNVSGSNLSGTTSVTVNGALASVSGITANGFSFVVPTGATFGTGTISVTAPCSQTVSSAFTVTQPTTATPTLTAPGNGSYVNTATPVYRGTAGAGSLISIYRNGALSDTTVANSLGNFHKVSGASLADGQYAVYVTATAPGALTSANSNTNAFTVDTTPPTVTLSSSTVASGGTTSATPVTFTAQFSESVGSSFTLSDLTVSGGTAGNLAAGAVANSYTFSVTPAVGLVSVSLAAGAAQDVATNDNVAATPNPYSFTYALPVTAAPVLNTPATNATTSATPTFSGTAPTGSTVTLYLAIGGGAAQSIGTTTATGGTFSFVPATALASGSYSAYATAQGSGQTVSDNSNTNLFTVDATAPTVVASTRQTPMAAVTNATSLTWRVTFSEGVSGVDGPDFTLTTTGTVSSSGRTVTPVSGSVYDVTLNGVSGNGTARLDLNASGAGITDAVGNSLSQDYTSGQVYTLDQTAPTLTLATTASEPTASNPLALTATFSEAVTGFDASDVQVSNGTLSGFSGSGTSYSFSVTPTASGSVTVSVLANAAQDAAGNGNAAATLSRTYQPAPTIASFTPTSGPVGTPVTLTGTNLSGTTRVTFNGVVAPTFTVNSATSLTATVPTGATTGPLAVTTPSGTATSASSFTVTVPVALAVVSTRPGRNALAATPATPVALTYNQAVDPATAGGVRMFSQQAGGRKAAAVSTSGSTVTLAPAAAFKPGETVFVTAAASVRPAGSGAPATVPAVFQFTTAAGVASGTFSGSLALAAGQLPASVSLADVDGDGDLDVLAPNGTRSGTVTVRFNTGRGNFSGTGSVAVGAYPAHLTTADVDGDGDLDLLTANAGDNSVSVRLNNGLGVFSGTSSVAVGAYPVSVTAADIDADGDLDLLAANLGSDNVSVRFNDGRGSFSGIGSVAVGPNTSSVEAADVDGDGDLDLLLANAGSSGTVSIRLNNGLGSFSGTQSVAVGAYPAHVTAADIDADGDLDLLTANALDAGTVSVRVNDGRGNFSGTTTLAVGRRPASVEAADVDGDGDLDVLTANAGSNTVSVRLNNGRGNFSGSQEVAVGCAPLRVAAADLDGDGDLDLATGDAGGNTVSVRFNQVPAAGTRTSALASLAEEASAASPLRSLRDGNLFQQLTGQAPAAGLATSLEVYPNPATATTRVRFVLAHDEVVSLQLYNALGQLIGTLYEGPAAADQTVEQPLTALELATGVYLCRLTLRSGLSLSQRLVVK